MATEIKVYFRNAGTQDAWVQDTKVSWFDFVEENFPPNRITGTFTIYPQVLTSAGVAPIITAMKDRLIDVKAEKIRDGVTTVSIVFTEVKMDALTFSTTLTSSSELVTFRASQINLL